MATIPSPTTNSVSVSHTAQKGLDPNVVNANTFGAQVGAAIQGFGQSIGQLGATFQQRDEQLKTTSALTTLSDTELRLNQQVEEQRRSTPGNSANYYDQSAPAIDNTVTEALNQLPPDMAEKFGPRFRDLANKAKQNEFDWGLKSQDTFFKSAVEKTAVDAGNLFAQGKISQDEATKRYTEVIANSGMLPQDQAAMKLQWDLYIQKTSYSMATKQSLNSVPVTAGSAIQSFEGMETSAYMDYHTSDGRPAGYRIGFGSDKVVMADGSIVPVTAGMVITPADAQRTLDYRLKNEFQPRVVTQVGEQSWAQLPPQAQAGLLSVAWNYGELPDTVVSAVGSGDLQAISEAVGNLSANPKRRQQEAAIISGANAAYRENDYATIPVTRDGKYWKAANVDYELGGIRELPVSAKTIRTVSGVASSIDPSLQVFITSAGQPEVGGPDERTGGDRHNVDKHTGEGETVDIVLSRNGKRITPAQDPQLYAAFIEKAAAAGMVGIGHYSWGIHVGGGSQAFWGPSKTSGDADPVLKAAWQRGLSQRTGGMDSDPRFADIPVEDRVVLRTQAEQEVARDQAAQRAQDTAQHAKAFNDFMFTVGAGNAGAADIQSAYENGIIRDWGEYKQATSALEEKVKETNLTALGASIVNGETVGVPGDPQHTKAVNQLSKTLGITQGLNDKDGAAASNYAMMGQRANMFSGEATALLNQMALNPDWTTAKFGLDTLAAAQAAAPEAFKLVMNKDQLDRLAEYNAMKGSYSNEAIQQAILGPRNPEERKAYEENKDFARNVIRTDYPPEVIKSMAIANNWFDPADNISGQTINALKTDWETRFLDAYAKTANKQVAETLANKAIEETWGQTDVGGNNVLMKFPPEKIGYPAFNGSHDYISQQVRADVGQTTGRAFNLIGDNVTANEIELAKQGRLFEPDGKTPRLPSYRVVTQNENDDAIGITQRWYGKITPQMLEKNVEYQQSSQALEQAQQRYRQLVSEMLLFTQAGQEAPQEKVDEFRALESQILRKPADLDPVAEDARKIRNIRDQLTGAMGGAAISIKKTGQPRQDQIDVIRRARSILNYLERR